ncbi:MAG: four helix bundle protein [Verrucomicrobiales bacterium]|nr:four helix bundle protein [Verrucomicrobiales bacterium]
MGVIRSFRDLKVYQEVLVESKHLFEISRRFPAEERFSLTDQIRRSSRAVNAMIAEAWARRGYPAVFRHKLSEALGEANETQAWLDHAREAGYLNETAHRELDAGWQSVGGRLRRMIDRADTFCPKSED